MTINTVQVLRCIRWVQLFSKRISHGKGGKLDSNWISPFTITRVLGKGLYRLESFDDPPTVVGRVNRVHLKPWLGKVYIIAGFDYNNTVQPILNLTGPQ